MDKKVEFCFKGKNITTFQISQEQKVYLSRFFDLPCGLDGKNDIDKQIKGLICFDSDIDGYSTDDLSLIEKKIDENSALFAFCDKDERVKIETKWQLCSQTGIWSRRDKICNIGTEELSFSSCLARFVFSPGNYEIYSQQSSWCNENQGLWQNVNHGTVVLGNEGGRTTQGGTPYLCLRNRDIFKGLAFHIIPCGNWVIKISSYTIDGYSLPFTVLEMGLSDKFLNLKISAGETFELPEILIQLLPGGNIEKAAPLLHQFLLEKHFKSAKQSAPVVYNTWLDAFECLEVERLRKQLKAAKEVGCEVFVVDAGWYGASDGDWTQHVGDWQEKQKSAFKGKMAGFAEQVRDAGLGFGLWMEPERNFATIAAVKEHPERFLKGTGEYYYPNLARKDAYDYILSEMSRLVDTYKVVWMKIDFNFRFGIDPGGSEFAIYYSKWYELLDDLRAKYPEVFFEGCASGGLRSDINTLSHFDNHFLSDNVNPQDVLRIYQQAILRLLPGRIGKWVTLRGIGNSVPEYGKQLNDSPMSFITPAGCGANWEESEIVDIDFAARAAFPGTFGLTGDLISLPKEAKKRLCYHVNFYKKWRQFIAGCKAHLLTPVKSKHDHTGWIAIQLQHPKMAQSLLCVYRLDDVSQEKTFCLRQLEPDSEYSVTIEHQVSTKVGLFTGLYLMGEGVNIKLPRRNDAAIIVIAKN